MRVTRLYLPGIIFLFMIQIIPATTKIPSSSESDTTVSNNKILYYSIPATSAYIAGEMLVLPNVWYKDKKRVAFHFFNDNKGFLQVDKFGHAFGSYFESYIGYRFLRNSGVNKTEALLFGATLGLILQSPIEIMDATHEGWGFSLGDMAANAVGSGIVIGQELLFDEQLIKFKFSYWESDYADMVNGYYGNTSLKRLLKDYNGHTYWLSMPLNKLIPDYEIPGWLNIAIGYGANGMLGEFENMTEYNGVRIPQTARYRQYLLSMDVDWTKIRTDSKTLNAILDVLTFIKLPFPALEFNSKGKFCGYWLYF